MPSVSWKKKKCDLPFALTLAFPPAPTATRNVTGLQLQMPQCSSKFLMNTTAALHSLMISSPGEDLQLLWGHELAPTMWKLASHLSVFFFYLFFFIVTEIFFFHHDNNLWLAAWLRPVGNREAVQSPAGPQCCWLPSSCRQGYRTWPKWRGWTATQHHAQPTKHVSVYNLTAAHIWFSRGEICVL